MSSANLSALEAGLFTIRCVYAVPPSNTLDTIPVHAEAPAITLDLVVNTATFGAVSPQSPAVYPETGAVVALLRGETPCIGATTQALNFEVTETSPVCRVLGAETRQTDPKTA